ncbi:MAG: integrin alpha, partial [Pseudomonadales bacterium]|nr:integrin alpha [Pseudomonadales bacterium]
KDPDETVDTDDDGVGNNEDVDDDNDGYFDTVEVSEGSDPVNANSIPADFDGDLDPDSTDLDDDNDGVSDLIEIELDFDPLDENNTPLDTDSDGIPDVQDLDDDGDGISDLFELQVETDPLDASDTPIDTDSDGNPNQLDLDDDNDGYSDVIELEEGSDPLYEASRPLDTDGDFKPNSTDPDDDNDGYSDDVEELEHTDPLDADSKPLDTDGDFEPNSTDLDDDNDSVNDDEDVFPLDATEWLDNDQDGLGDNADTDDDNDLVLDVDDAFPFLVGEWSDFDGDGVGDNSDHYSSDPSVVNDDVCWSDADGNGLCDQMEAGITDINLDQLHGHNGLTIDGAKANDRMGQSVSGLGDINGDGFDDYAVSALRYEPVDSVVTNVGQVYVFFGKAEKGESNIDFSEDAPLDGSDGFRITGSIQSEQLGYEMSALGDINKDGFDDFIIGSAKTETYVIFGHGNAWDADFDLTSLNGLNGFNIVDGQVTSQRGVVKLGDINGDGYSDFIIETLSKGFFFLGNDEDWPSTIDFTNEEEFSQYGFIVQELYGFGAPGDFNGDGFDDVVITFSTINEDSRAAVIFSHTDISAQDISPEGIDGSNGIILIDNVERDNFGARISSADINNDGFSDVFLSASPNDGDRIWHVYVVFGTDLTSIPEINMDDLNGANGLVLMGENKKDLTGNSIKSIGDFNGDDIEDILISATQADLDEVSKDDDTGRVYLLYGSNAVWPSNINLFSMEATQGFAFNGYENSSVTGLDIDGLGDIDGDGLNDVVMNAPLISPKDRLNASQAYLIYGFNLFKSTE